MKYIIIVSMLIELGYANAITLEQILTSSKKHNKFIKSLDQKSIAQEAKNQADTASDPIELFTTGTKAYPTNAPNDYEYAAGISKKILLDNIQAKEQLITRLNNQAGQIEEEIEILNFHQAIKNLYHQHCVDFDDYQSFIQNYKDFEKLYSKKEKAYNYQEISKTELMQLAIEKNRLFAQLQQSKMRQERSRESLLLQSHLDATSKSQLSCNDTYPIQEDIKYSKEQFILTKEAYKKRISSTKNAIQRYSTVIDSIDLSVQYDKEIDIEKYSIGVSIPLNFTSKRSESERVAAMHQEQAISLKHEEEIHQKKGQIVQLKAKLQSKAIMIGSIKKDLQSYKNELLPLIKKSYDLGESSVIEYLLNRQKYYQLKQELFTTQREYYQTLFTLYSVIESKE